MSTHMLNWLFLDTDTPNQMTCSENTETGEKGLFDYQNISKWSANTQVKLIFLLRRFSPISDSSAKAICVI